MPHSWYSAPSKDRFTHYLVEAHNVDVVEQLGKQLYREGSIDATPAQQSHRRAEHGQHQTGRRVVIDVFRQKLVQRLGQLDVKYRHEIAERRLHALCQHFLRLYAERRDVSVRFEKVQKLGTVGHPEGQYFGIGVLLLDNVLDQIGNVVQKHGQLVGPLGRLQVRTVVRRGAIPSAQVERIHGR